MLNWRLLWITGMHVLSTKLMPEHIPKTCEPQNHCKSHKAAQHALHKVVIGECAWKGLANVDTRIRDNNV